MPHVPSARPGWPRHIPRGYEVSATVRSRRPKTVVLASVVALALSAAPAAFAQEGDSPIEPGVTCDAEILDEEDGFPYYLVEPGQTLECIAVGLAPESDTEWVVDVYGDIDLGEEGELLEPVATFDSGGPVASSADGELSFSFTLPAEVTIGDFDGVVWQGDAEAPDYEEFLGGLIMGDVVEGEMTCDPDTAPRGSEVDCVAAVLPGAFDYEVYELAERDLVEFLTGDVELAPAHSGSGETDDDGTAAFTFTLSSTGEAEAYLAVVDQGDAFALFVGDIVAAETSPPTPVDVDEEEEDDTPVVAVPRPNRVDAGAGGTAPVDGTPLAVVLASVLALAGFGAVRRSAAVER
jgi:hypothetical protein